MKYYPFSTPISLSIEITTYICDRNRKLQFLSRHSRTNRRASVSVLNRYVYSEIVATRDPNHKISVDKVRKVFLLLFEMQLVNRTHDLCTRGGPFSLVVLLSANLCRMERLLSRPTAARMYRRTVRLAFPNEHCCQCKSNGSSHRRYFWMVDWIAYTIYSRVFIIIRLKQQMLADP